MDPMDFFRSLWFQSYANHCISYDDNPLTYYDRQVVTQKRSALGQIVVGDNGLEDYLQLGSE